MVMSTLWMHFFDTVQIFDKDGRFLLAFGNTGRGNGQMILPAGLFIDEQDNIYAVDSYNNRVQIFQYLKEKGSRDQVARDSSGKRSRTLESSTPQATGQDGKTKNGN